jgi:hypothetical protein
MRSWLVIELEVVTGLFLKRISYFVNRAYERFELVAKPPRFNSGNAESVRAFHVEHRVVQHSDFKRRWKANLLTTILVIGWETKREREFGEAMFAHRF